MKLTDQLLENKKNGKALLATNFYNFETLVAVLTAARDTDSSLILQLSENSIRYMGLEVATAMARSAISQFGVRAWLHLDHGHDLSLIKSCIDAGFDSVMIDASERPFEENVRLTREIMKYAQASQVNVEAELGYISKLGQDQKMIYTQPGQAREFIGLTGVNALAIAVGSAHGFYKETPMLQLDLIEEINSVSDAALVLHGSSGIPDDQLKEAIRRGITKINLATEIKNVFMGSLQQILKATDNIDLRQVFPAATSRATALVTQKLKIINNP